MFFVRSIILLFLIGFSFSVYSQNTDVGGIYIGEQHGNPVNAQKFIDNYKAGTPNQSGGGLLSILTNPSKKTQYFYVSQNKNGVFVHYIKKHVTFASMKMNDQLEFSGSFNKHTIEGYFDENIFYGHVKWMGETDHYLVGILSDRDQIIREEIGGLGGAKETIANQKNKIDELNSKIEELDKIINVENPEVVEGLLTDHLLEIETLKEDYDNQISSLNNKLNQQPKININNVDLVDTVKKGAILWSGPDKNKAKEILKLSEGTRISTLRRVRNDDTWSLVAIESGRIGYVQTQFIKPGQGGAIPDGPVTPVPTNNDIEIYSPEGIKENSTFQLNATGLQIIKGRFNQDKIKNVESVTFNKEEAKFKSNLFMKAVKIQSGLNKINIQILTASGEQYEFNFIIQAP